MKILFVNACVRGEESRTLKLCRAALEELGAGRQEVTVEEVCLDREEILPLDSRRLRLRTELEEKGQFDHEIFRYARQFAQADLILIGAPYWEYQFPALLRCYLELISAGGVTFVYTEEGRPRGLCKARRLLYITTSGGPIGDRNCGFDYIRTLCGDMLGIPEIRFAAAEGLDIWGTDVEAKLDRAREEIHTRLLDWREEDKGGSAVSECRHIITIGREYGAGGRTVAKRLSEVLGIPYYDKDIITMTAEKSGFTEEMIEGTEESDTGRSIFNWFMPNSSASSYDQAILAQAQTIRNTARQGPCIIVGRGADYILRDFENVLNVFVFAQEEDKIRYAMEKFDETREQAAKRVRHSDAARGSYYHYLTGGKWGDLRHYDLTINSSVIGKEACADVILTFLRKREER